MAYKNFFTKNINFTFFTDISQQLNITGSNCRFAKSITFYSRRVRRPNPENRLHMVGPMVFIYSVIQFQSSDPVPFDLLIWTYNPLTTVSLIDRHCKGHPKKCWVFYVLHRSGLIPVYM